jgi:hypothetical protein
VDGRGGTRSFTSGLSFCRIYAWTLPSPWTHNGGNVLPSSPARGADLASSATPSMTTLRRSTRSSRSHTGCRRRRKRKPRRPRWCRSLWRSTSPRTCRRREALRWAIEESELVELGYWVGLGAQLAAYASTTGATVSTTRASASTSRAAPLPPPPPRPAPESQYSATPSRSRCLTCLQFR